jgi:hypothetical protein
MHLDREIREVTVEPLEMPEPLRQAEPERAPATSEPIPVEPEKVPAFVR